jgi:hypothetical protein
MPAGISIKAEVVNLPFELSRDKTLAMLKYSNDMTRESWESVKIFGLVSSHFADDNVTL